MEALDTATSILKALGRPCPNKSTHRPPLDLKLALFKIHHRIKENDFGYQFLHYHQGMKILQELISIPEPIHDQDCTIDEPSAPNPTLSSEKPQTCFIRGNTLAYALQSFSIILAMDMSWDDIQKPFVWRVADLVTHAKAPNVSLAATEVLAQLSGRPRIQDMYSTILGQNYSLGNVDHAVIESTSMQSTGLLLSTSDIKSDVDWRLHKNLDHILDFLGDLGPTVGLGMVYFHGIRSVAGCLDTIVKGIEADNIPLALKSLELINNLLRSAYNESKSGATLVKGSIGSDSERTSQKTALTVYKDIEQTKLVETIKRLMNSSSKWALKAQIIEFQVIWSHYLETKRSTTISLQDTHHLSLIDSIVYEAHTMGEGVLHGPADRRIAKENVQWLHDSLIDPESLQHGGLLALESLAISAKKHQGLFTRLMDALMDIARDDRPALMVISGHVGAFWGQHWSRTLDPLSRDKSDAFQPWLLDIDRLYTATICLFLR